MAYNNSRRISRPIDLVPSKVSLYHTVKIEQGRKKYQTVRTIHGSESLHGSESIPESNKHDRVRNNAIANCGITAVNCGITACSSAHAFLRCGCLRNGRLPLRHICPTATLKQACDRGYHTAWRWQHWHSVKRIATLERLPDII